MPGCRATAASAGAAASLSSQPHPVSPLLHTPALHFRRAVQGNAQLLGMKGADKETNIWKIRLQLMKPVTWIPLIWGELSRLFAPYVLFRVPSAAAHVGRSLASSCLGCALSLPCFLLCSFSMDGSADRRVREPPGLPIMSPPECKMPPLAAGVLCGAAASGQFEWTPEDVAKSLLCMVMSGPLLTGYTQVRHPLASGLVQARQLEHGMALVS